MNHEKRAVGRRARVALCMLLLTALVFGQSHSQAPLPLADVELTLRGTDAQLLRNTTIAVQAVTEGGRSADKIETRTDNEGIARIHLNAGRYRFSVIAHLLGHADSGMSDVAAGSLTHVNVPPFQALGSLEGVVPPTCNHDVVVQASAQYVGAQRATADSSGHFRFEDVEAGDWYLLAFAGGDNLCADSVSNVPLKSGQSVGGLSLRPAAYGPTAYAHPNPTPVLPTKTEQPKPHAVVLLRGTVTDEAGHPVPEATVYADFTYSGSIRMGERSAKTTTDAEGHYEVSADSDLRVVGTSIVAIVQGHPPAFAWPTIRQSDPAPVTQNLIVPSKSGSLNVAVLKDGQAAADVSVSAVLDVGTMAGLGGSFDSPVTRTDTNGVARFDSLLPGRYTIYALSGEKKDISAREIAMRRASAVASGIPVAISETTSHTLQLYEHKRDVAFQVLREDGSAQTGNIPFQGGPVDTVQWFSSMRLDGEGKGHSEMAHDGIWSLRFVHKGTSSDGGASTNDFREPFSLAQGVVAVSPNLPIGSVPAFQSRWVNAPSVRVHLRDGNGKPVLANIKVVDRWGTIYGSGATDQSGDILFSGLLANTEYSLVVIGTELTKIKPLVLGMTSPALPEQLAPQHVIPIKKFVAVSGVEHDIVLRPEPMSYVYGTLHRGASRDAPNWGFSFSIEQQETVFGVGATSLFHGRAVPGEFVIGPFIPGRQELMVGGENNHFTVDVDVPSDKPLHLDIDIDKYLASAQGSSDSITAAGESVMGMGGISTHAAGAQHLVGRVFLSDGVTPALGAQVLYFSSASHEPAVLGVTDALGNIQPRGLWSGMRTSSGDRGFPPPVAAPVVVALLPGACGATLYTRPVRRDEPIRIVLPPAIAVQGTVSLGGRSLLGSPGVVRVIAAHQGAGALDQVLNVETTAQADGQFTLAGLTPGDYLVQAVLDNIWLSSTIELHVDKNDLKSVNLQIPSPGKPVLLRLRDASGRPLVGQSLKLDRSGPFSALWPREWKSDGAGNIYVPTLEAGRHIVGVAGKSYTFKVQSLKKAGVASPIVVNLAVVQ